MDHGEFNNEERSSPFSPFPFFSISDFSLLFCKGASAVERASCGKTHETIHPLDDDVQASQQEANYTTVP